MRYKAKYIRNQSLPSFLKEIKLSFHADSAILASKNPLSNEQTVVESNVAESKDRGIYILQQIKLHGELFNIFFDSGCSDFLITQDAVNRLGPNATMISKVPVSVRGLGGSKTHTEHGLYRVKLPLITGEHARMTGVCLLKLTDEFTKYPQ